MKVQRQEGTKSVPVSFIWGIFIINGINNWDFTKAFCLSLCFAVYKIS